MSIIPFVDCPTRHKPLFFPAPIYTVFTIHFVKIGTVSFECACVAALPVIVPADDWDPKPEPLP
jgi:hypothetical protein